MPARDGTTLMAELDRRMHAAQRVTVRCAHCPRNGAGRGFKFTGPVDEARARFAEHRETAHPELGSIETARTRQRKTRRVGSTGLTKANKFATRREFQSAADLREREELRRMVRSDLPPLSAEEAAA